MRLAGSSRRGRHLGNGNEAVLDGAGSGPARKRAKPAKKGAKRLLIALAIVAGVVIVFVVGLYMYVKFGVQEPAVKDSKRNSSRLEGMEYIDPDNPDDPAQPRPSQPTRRVPEVRKEGKIHTFLILCTDDDNYNTDTILVVKFDATEYTLDVVSIPRDTMVNVSWPTKKANSIWANMRARFRNADDPEGATMQATVEGFADILGFEVDRWLVVDLKAFVALVDAVKGIDFDIPVNMNYHDPIQNLHIVYSKGMKHLNGQQALEVMRYRSGYANADIGRIGTQQDFMKTAAEQIIAKTTMSNITDLAGIFMDYVKTDMELSDIIWFGREFLKLDNEKISFDIMPGNYADKLSNGDSYVTIYVDQWLELINSKLNPWEEDITVSDVSIRTRGAGGNFYVTDGGGAGDLIWGRSSNAASGGSGSSSPRPSTSTSPRPSSSASPSPSPSSSPRPSSSPSPSPSNSPSPSPSPSPSGSPSPSPSNSPPGNSPEGPDDDPDNPPGGDGDNESPDDDPSPSDEPSGEDGPEAGPPPDDPPPQEPADPPPPDDE